MAHWIKTTIMVLLVTALTAVLIYGRFFWPPEQVFVNEQNPQGNEHRVEDGHQDEQLDESEQQVNVWQLTIESVSGFTATDESTGLDIVLEPGEVVFTNGETLTIEQTIVPVYDQQTTHIMLDLDELTLQPLAGSAHTGAIHIATVTAAGGQITNIDVPDEFHIPQSHVATTNQKRLHTNETLKVALLGDFNASRAEQAMEHVYADLSADRLEVDHYTSLNQAVRLGIIQLHAPHVAWSDYDVILIGYTYAATDQFIEQLEQMVSQIRAAGTEVIFVVEEESWYSAMAMGSGVPSNDGFTAVTHNSAALQEVMHIAEQWGAEIADIYSYSRALQQRSDLDFGGIEATGDSGESAESVEDRLLLLAWEKALRSILNERDQEQALVSLPDASALTLFPVATGQGVAVNPALHFEPVQHSGTYASVELDPFYEHLAGGYGKSQELLDVLLLQAGGEAQFYNEAGIALDLLVDGSSPFTAQLRIANSTFVVQYLSGGAAGVEPHVRLIEGITAARQYDFPFLHQRGINLVVTSGEMRLIGAVFYEAEAE